MAEKQKTGEIQILECQIQINPRGRRVVNGTLLDRGELTEFGHELSDLEKSQILKLISSFVD